MVAVLCFDIFYTNILLIGTYILEIQVSVRRCAASGFTLAGVGQISSSRIRRKNKAEKIRAWAGGGELSRERKNIRRK